MSDGPPKFSEGLTSILTESARRGFLGPGPVQTHLVHAHGYLSYLPRTAHGQEIALLDLGSGGGVPGLPLLVWRSDLVGVLLDAMAKRTRFLDYAIMQLGLSERADVVTARAEDSLSGGGYRLAASFDVVVSRSFGPPSATLELAAHFTRLQGRVLISEPPGGRIWEPDDVASLGLQQVSEPGSPVAAFDLLQPPPPLRSWKAVTKRPSVRVTVK